MTALPRMVPLRAAPTFARKLARIACMIAALWIVAGFVVAPRVLRMFGESKADIARAVAKQYAFEVFPAWQLEHGRTCPRSLLELATYMDRRDIKDPWGNDYMFLCAHGGFIVYSLGEDERLGTADDVWSHR